MFFQSTAIVILLLFYGCYYMKLKIAFLQLLPGAAIEDNIEKGIKACREAREKGADIALFPEMWSSGYVFPHDEEWLKKNSVSLDSAYVKRFSGLARELQMAIAITLHEKYEPNPRIPSASLTGMESWFIAIPRYISFSGAGHLSF